jgi:Rieske Fe-S protein
MKYNQINSNIIKLSIFILFFSLTGSCHKDDGNVVPTVFVSLHLDMTSELAGIRGFGVFVTITPDSTNTLNSIVDFHDSAPGYGKRTIPQATQNNGIIIYHSVFAEYGEYVAFDLTCPYNAFVPKPNGDCALKVDGRLSLPICPCCGSVFNLENAGWPSGKAKHTLVAYKISFSSDGLTMYVTN